MYHLFSKETKGFSPFLDEQKKRFENSRFLYWLIQIISPCLIAFIYFLTWSVNNRNNVDTITFVEYGIFCISQILPTHFENPPKEIKSDIHGFYVIWVPVIVFDILRLVFLGIFIYMDPMYWIASAVSSPISLMMGIELLYRRCHE